MCFVPVATRSTFLEGRLGDIHAAVLASKVYERVGVATTRRWTTFLNKALDEVSNLQLLFVRLLLFHGLVHLFVFLLLRDA